MQIPVPLDRAEIFILKELFDDSRSETHHPNFNTSSIIQECENAGFATEEADVALTCLVDRGYLDGTVYIGSNRPTVHFTPIGFEEVCERFVADYHKAQEKVALYLSQLTEASDAQLTAMAQALGLPFLVTRHFVEFFAHLGWVRMQREDDEYAFITYVSPLLSRALEDREVNADVR